MTTLINVLTVVAAISWTVCFVMTGWYLYDLKRTGVKNLLTQKVILGLSAIMGAVQWVSVWGML